MFKTQSIKVKLILAFLVIGLAPAASVGWLAYLSGATA